MYKKVNCLFIAGALFLCLISMIIISGCTTSSEGTQETVQIEEEVPESVKQQNADKSTEYDNKVAVIVTDKGTIKFKFYPIDAPKTVENFVKLANEGFYNGIKFHRVEPGFVIQGGDPNSKDSDPSNDGQGGPGYNIPAEFNEQRHIDGAVAMARSSDPDSAGSQFYICLGDQPNLNGKYTVFGQVTEGLDVVHKIEKNDVMKKVYIEEN